jgi:hypothetical protein
MPAKPKKPKVKGLAKSARIYGARRSKPGEPPYKQTGHLRRSVAWEVTDTLKGRVGSNLMKARWLELGTRKMAARPWLRRAFLEKRNEVKRILGVS